MAFDSSSDLSSVPSSPLSSPASSPSPPPELSLKAHAYPSPPRSQGTSQTGSPCPDGTDSSAVMSERDGPPPAKRRRISERKPRTTEYLDLRSPTIDDEQAPILEKLVRSLHKKRKIVVVAGAGISVSAGIPDFRSSTGLFTTLRQEHNLKGSGKHLFDASVYKDDSSTSSFHDMVRNMSKLTKEAKPTKFHHMLATLAQDDRLLRLYTQNVDGIDTGLEPLATTIPLKKTEDGKWPKSIQLHGGLDKMVCSKCGETSNFDADRFDGPLAPVCETCVELDRLRTDVAGKRSHGIGRLRPRMVLYNEHNPDDEAIGAVTKDDLRKRPDAVIVVGTSLKIPGVKRIVREMCATVRDRRDGVTVWINNDPEPLGKEFEDCWDIVVRGACDEVARHAALRHWYEMDDSLEPTEEEWNKACQKEVSVVINKSFKALPATESFKRSLPSPDYSPIASRTISVIGDSFSSEEEIVVGPPTPSKSARGSPKKNTSKISVFDALGSKAVTKATKVPKAKQTNVKYVKKSTPKAVSKKTAASQAKINQTFKQTKASTVSITKSAKVKAEESAMRIVPSKDSRVNASPVKMTPMFPNLSPKKGIDSRMKVESIMN